MAELKFSGCRLEVQLEAQSPMIHFQYMQPGATIRASEVKPKLDHFILRRLQKETGLDIGDLKKSSKYRSIFIDGENNVLDYRMKLDASAAPYSVVAVGELRTKEYDIYYGNSGKKTEEEKLKGVFSNPKLTILCFNRTLRMLIERWTEAFFMVTNFGTMQNKGFGSFAPAGIWGADGRLGMSEQKQLAEYLKEETGAAHCYCMRFKEVPDDLQEKNEYCKKMFAEIKSFYSIMKSGQNFKGYARSYLYQYMHGRDNNNNAGAVSIDNEKAWMKQNGIAPIVAKPQNVKRTDLKDENPRYVRALLGTSGSVSYVKEDRKRVAIAIADKSRDKLDRVPSPIVFKIVRNVVFIAAREVPEEIYDREFQFYNKAEGKGGILKTPSKDDFKSGRFDIDSFLKSYVAYYNSAGLRQELYGIKNNTWVKEV